MTTKKGFAGLPADLTSNPEFQSSAVRLAVWVFGTLYIGLAAWTDYYKVDIPYFLTVFGVFILALLGVFVSILIRPVWPARRYVSMSLDIVVISLAISITCEAISPFYLLYIWIFISAGTRYGTRYLVLASVESVVAYSLVLTTLHQWSKHPFEAVFFLLILVFLPVYQYALLRRVQQAKDEAERANKAKGDFLAFMTHELRTPLTGVIGMTELLKTTPLDTEQQDYVGAISQSAKMLSALIGDILDFSKIDAAKLRLERLPFKPRAVVREVCGVLEGLAVAEGVELTCEVAAQVPETITGDQLRVRQILFNLVGNAVKFTEEGEVRVRVTVSPPAEGIREPHLLLEVEDTGIGIPADKIAHIFESFRQADDSTTRRFGGSGLGTTIALELSRLMGGSIGVASEEGHGSRFWVRLPLLRGAPPPPPAAASRLRGLRALILESNHTHRDLICAALEHAGVSCRALADPAEIIALGIAPADLDFLVIADRLPGGDLVATRRAVDAIIGERGADDAAPTALPCLFLVYAARRPVVQSPRMRCLGKPFLAEDLIGAVEQLLGLAPASLPGEAPTPGFARSAATALAGIRVLVAEDNKIAAKVLTTFLTKMAIAYTQVEDGEQALREALAGDYGIAIIDLRMPKLDGIAFTRRYHALAAGRELPIVALTANASEEVKQECLAAGMVDFLAKPVSPELLRQTIERLAVRR
ncbi:ATP-binding protein [uncultured Thiodictyon sp.]|uniref:ATP-binding protein n=1 Tax=uncultured Thiodictyon sp. TaxID=1846217 RepID=UPI0025D800CD|nr:ATP-binding protein [uncultured Thiodictyon sp.]